VPFDKFDLSKAGSATDYGNMGTGVSFTPSRTVGLYHAGNKEHRLMQTSVAMKNPLEVVRDEHYLDNIGNLAKKLGVKEKPVWSGTKQKNKAFSDEFREKAMEAGYDGAITRLPNNNRDILEVTAYDPDQITILKNVGAKQ